MTNEMMISILMATGMSKHDAELHTKQGVTIYEDTESERAGFMEEGLKIEEPEETEAIWNAMDTVTYKGIKYRYDLVL